MKNKNKQSLLGQVNVYAINLNEGRLIHIKNEDETDTISFEWEKKNKSTSSSTRNMLIDIARKFQSYSQIEILNLAISIKNIIEIKAGDYVIGFTQNNMIKKAGYIESNYNEDNIQNLKIKWIKNTERYIPAALFKPQIIVQKFTLKMIEKMQSELQIIDEKIPNYYKKIFIKNAAISEDYNFLDTFSQKLETFEKIETLNPKKETGGNIDLFYGTNRNRTNSRETDKFFDDLPSDLKFGVCTVSIPKGHVEGDMERPNFWKLQFKENADRDIIIQGIEELDRENFNKMMLKSYQILNKRTAMLFVHGYNVSFAEAARRAGQIAWDMPFNGLTGFFSWPSSGNKISYLADGEKADGAMLALKSFIELLVTDSGIEQLHLVAHSMGNKILTASLSRLSMEQSFEKYLPMIKQIVFAAADIDQNVFRTTYLPDLLKVGERRTIYASDMDNPLKISEAIRIKMSRIGQAGDNLFVACGIDTVDASNVPVDDNGHGYVFNTKEVLSDLYYLLTKGLNPFERRLKARKKDGIDYWIFPQ